MRSKAVLARLILSTTAVVGACSAPSDAEDTMVESLQQQAIEKLAAFHARHGTYPDEWQVWSRTFDDPIDFVAYPPDGFYFTNARRTDFIVGVVIGRDGDDITTKLTTSRATRTVDMSARVFATIRRPPATDLSSKPRPLDPPAIEGLRSVAWSLVDQ